MTATRRLLRPALFTAQMLNTKIALWGHCSFRLGLAYLWGKRELQFPESQPEGPKIALSPVSSWCVECRCWWNIRLNIPGNILQCFNICVEILTQSFLFMIKFGRHYHRICKPAPRHIHDFEGRQFVGSFLEGKTPAGRTTASLVLSVKFRAQHC